MATTKKVLVNEADDTKDLVFDYDGETYVAPALKLWPVEVLEAQEAGRNATAVKELVGDKQYAKFKAKPRTVTDLGDFLTAMIESTGVSPGE